MIGLVSGVIRPVKLNSEQWIVVAFGTITITVGGIVT
jgi:hypothetical protein